MFLFLLALFFFGYMWKAVVAKQEPKSLHMSRGEGHFWDILKASKNSPKTQPKCTEPKFPWESWVSRESRAVNPENQPWNLSAELEHEETLVVPQNSIQLLEPWFLGAKSNCSSSKVAGTVHTVFYFHFNSMNPISLTRTMNLAKVKCNSATQQKVCLVANGFSLLWKNPDPTDVHDKMATSFSGARISPACVHWRKREKKFKLVQLILAQLKRSFLGHSDWRAILQESIPCVTSQV